MYDMKAVRLFSEVEGGMALLQQEGSAPQKTMYENLNAAYLRLQQNPLPLFSAASYLPLAVSALHERSRLPFRTLCSACLQAS
jgi:hypothetical protein